MIFTPFERLSLLLTCDTALPANKREFDHQLISELLSRQHEWAIEWHYSTLGLDIPTPPEVEEVADIIDMWSFLEASFNRLDLKEQAALGADPEMLGTVRFAGFDGNGESEQLSITTTLIERMGRWSEFKGRDLNSHAPCSLEGYRRMLPVWKCVRAGAHSWGSLGPAQIKTVMRELVHPEYRDVQSNGTWTMKASAVGSNV